MALILGVFYCSQNKVKRLSLKAMHASNISNEHDHDVGHGHGYGQGQNYGYNDKAAQFSAQESVAMANLGRASEISPSSRGSDFDHSSIYSGTRPGRTQRASFQPYVASGASRPSAVGVVGTHTKSPTRTSTVSRREY